MVNVSTPRLLPDLHLPHVPGERANPQAERMKWSVVHYVATWLLEQNGGKMNGKTIGGIAVIAVLIVLGFLAYRFLMMEMIMKMAHH